MECPYCKESDYEYMHMEEQNYDNGVDEQFWLVWCYHCHKEFIIKEVYIIVEDDMESMTMERFNSGKY